MSIDQHDHGRTLDTDHGSQAGEGHGDRLHVRAVRPSLDASQAARHDRPAPTQGLRELPVEVLEHAAGHGEAGAQAKVGGIEHRGPERVTCSHCGRRVLTRNSGAMWGHTRAMGEKCHGSKTWDYSVPSADD